MKARSVCGNIAGVFLILYGLLNLWPHLWLYRTQITYDVFQGNKLLIVRGVLFTVASLLMLLVAIFLFARKQKYAAITMSVSAVAWTVGTLITELPNFKGEYYLYGGFEAPVRFVLIPVLMTLATLLFAVTLFLRGPAALVVSILSAASYIGYVYMNSRVFIYIAPHPGPGLIILPLLFLPTAICTGVFAFFGKNKSKPVPAQTEEQTERETGNG